MSVAFIICEYNPFHNGHKYQITKIREMLGKDTVVVSLMSGSTVQRGEVAVADKYSRAAAAVCCGADIVLELPYPYSSLSAELFALGAVSIANNLCIGTHLVFGSENGDINSLNKHANRRVSIEFEESLLQMRRANKDLSYPKLVENCYHNLYGEDFPKTPNDILGVFYLSSIISLDADLIPLTHLRLENASATLARQEMKEGSIDRIPQEARAYFSDIPATIQNGERVILHALMNAKDHNLSKAAFGSASYDQLLHAISNKNCTNANLRRTVLHGVLGYNERNFSFPKFTTLLAMKQSAGELLRKAKKLSRIPIITKPSDYKEIPGIKDEFELNLRADALYAHCCNKSIPANWSLTKTPFVKK